MCLTPTNKSHWEILLSDKKRIERFLIFYQISWLSSLYVICIMWEKMVYINTYYGKIHSIHYYFIIL